MVHPSSKGFKWNALTLCRDPDFEPLVFMRNLLVGHLTSDQLQLAIDFVNRKKIFSNEKTRAKSYFLSVVACHTKLPLSVKINRFITNNHFFLNQGLQIAINQLIYVYSTRKQNLIFVLIGTYRPR